MSRVAKEIKPVIEEGEGLRSSNSWYERNKAIFRRNRGQGTSMAEVGGSAGRFKKKKKQRKIGFHKGREKRKQKSVTQKLLCWLLFPSLGGEGAFPTSLCPGGRAPVQERSLVIQLTLE